MAILGGPVHFGLEAGSEGGLSSVSPLHCDLIGTYRSSRLITLGPFCGCCVTGLARTGSSSITY
jgi:hypothetical protein